MKIAGFVQFALNRTESTPTPCRIDAFPMDSAKFPVVPAYAGTQHGPRNHLDSRLRGNDDRESAEVLERIRRLL